jgi:hypothetical protein
MIFVLKFKQNGVQLFYLVILLIFPAFKTESETDLVKRKKKTNKTSGVVFPALTNHAAVLSQNLTRAPPPPSLIVAVGADAGCCSAIGIRRW